MAKHTIQAGNILLSQPFMMDQHFKRGVVLIVEHRPDGDVGFILNKPINMQISEVVEGFPDFDADLFYGGPVATDTLHYIHNCGDLLEGSTEIARGVYWGGDYDSLKFLIKSDLIKPKNIKFFIGYSGWSEGQLLEELEAGSWILDEMHHNYAFKRGENDKDLWKEVIYAKGDSYQIIAHIPDDPRYN